MVAAQAEAATVPTIILGDFNTLSRQKCIDTRKFLESRGYTTPYPTGTATWRGGGLRMHADWIFVRGVKIERWGVARPLERFRSLAHLDGDCILSMHITSRDNSLLRQVRAVRDGKIEELIFIEGLRLCEETHRSNLEIEAVVVSEELWRKERAAQAIDQLAKVAKRVASVSEKLLESVSYTKTPQGIIVLAQRPESSEARLAASLGANPLLVVLHQINNPVNVGAILRTSEAAGATGVITTRNTSDPFSPKSLRGAMGSAFRLPIWSGPDYEQTIEWCRQQ